MNAVVRDGSVNDPGLQCAPAKIGVPTWHGLPRKRPGAVSRGLAKDVAIMSEISNIGITNSHAAACRTLSTAPDGQIERGGQGTGVGESDPVEFSRMGRMLAGTMDTSSLRLAKIQALRAEIADGTFETHERIEGTVYRLIQKLE